MNAIETLSHLEIAALRERLTSRLRELHLRVPELPRLDPQTLEVLSSLIEGNSVLRSGARSLRAGRAWLVGVLLGLLVALNNRPDASGDAQHGAKLRDEHLERRTARPLRASARQANGALRFNKSCVLWARFLS